jgi:hypothetical protein
MYTIATGDGVPVLLSAQAANLAEILKDEFTEVGGASEAVHLPSEFSTQVVRLVVEYLELASLHPPFFILRVRYHAAGDTIYPAH